VSTTRVRTGAVPGEAIGALARSATVAIALDVCDSSISPSWRTLALAEREIETSDRRIGLERTTTRPV